MTHVLPVIHHLDTHTTLEQAALAMNCGADGVFLISHQGADDDLPPLAATLKGRYPGKLLGINLLGQSVQHAYQAALDFNLDAVWADSAGVSSAGLTDTGAWLADQIRHNASAGPLVFASVAFKYQPVEPHPAGAASAARAMGAVPTTSGARTGLPPTREKIGFMSSAAGGVLAVASGMDCDNVAGFVPMLSHILVATGVSVDDHHFDVDKLSAFVEIVRKTAGGVVA